MTKDNGGPAFPHESSVCSDHGIFPEIEPGMTLRDYFAAQVIAGVLAHGIPTDASDRQFVADHAYLFADAMLEARK